MYAFINKNCNNWAKAIYCKLENFGLNIRSSLQLRTVSQ